MSIAEEALEAVLQSEKWKDMCGLDESTIYGELAIDVANAAIEACAKIADDRAKEYEGFTEEENSAQQIASSIRSRSQKGEGK